MTLSSEEIQQPRSPSELVAFVEAVRVRATEDTETRTAGHLRIGNYKQFFDEIVPLARFAQHAYPADHTIKPILGNQGYDAEVRDARGKLVDRIEIANPIDGKSIAETGLELVQHGIGGFRLGDPGDEVEDLIPIIARTAAKKAIKDYSDATVVFNVSGFPPFQGFEARHEEQIARIRQTLADAGFKAKRVFVLLPSGSVERIDA
jgi:hypothetical protein